jgi:hypothetical protein
MKLNRVKTGTKGSIYKDQGSGRIFFIRPTDRRYKGKRRPVLYISELVDRKAYYITGIFSTPIPGQFTGDRVDQITGLKKIIVFTFIDGGQTIEIEGPLVDAGSKV